MAELRLELRIKNQALWQAIVDKCPPERGAIARCAKLLAPSRGCSWQSVRTRICSWLSLKESPWKKRSDQEPTDSALWLAAFLEAEPIRLFPPELYRNGIPNKLLRVVDSRRLLTGGKAPALPSPEQQVINRNLLDSLTLRARLTGRETTVITARFGLDGDSPAILEELSEQLSVSGQMVRVIEARALHKLRRAGGADCDCPSCKELRQEAESLNPPPPRLERAEICLECGEIMTRVRTPHLITHAMDWQDYKERYDEKSREAAVAHAHLFSQAVDALAKRHAKLRRRRMLRLRGEG